MKKLKFIIITFALLAVHDLAIHIIESQRKPTLNVAVLTDYEIFQSNNLLEANFRTRDEFGILRLTEEGDTHLLLSVPHRVSGFQVFEVETDNDGKRSRTEANKHFHYLNSSEQLLFRNFPLDTPIGFSFNLSRRFRFIDLFQSPVYRRGFFKLEIYTSEDGHLSAKTIQID